MTRRLKRFWPFWAIFELKKGRFQVLNRPLAQCLRAQEATEYIAKLWADQPHTQEIACVAACVAREDGNAKHLDVSAYEEVW